MARKPRFNWARLYAPKGSVAALYSANHVAEAKHARRGASTDERKPPRHRRNPFAKRS